MDLGKVFILGDSYSTFDKWIPEGYASWYFNAAREETNVDNVDQTWWKIVLDSTESELVLNCSWSGTTACNTGYSGDCSETSFIGRFEKLVDKGFFEENQIDTFFIFGGTNDSWSNAPLGELMFDDISKEDRFCVLPGFCYLFKRVKEVLPNARIINIVNTDIKPEIISGASKAAEELGIENIVLNNINKTAGHPNKTGMSEIAQQVLTAIGEQK